MEEEEKIRTNYTFKLIRNHNNSTLYYQISPENNISPNCNHRHHYSPYHQLVSVYARIKAGVEPVEISVSLPPPTPLSPLPRLVNPVTSHSVGACVSPVHPQPVFSRLEARGPVSPRYFAAPLHFHVFLCPSHRSHGVFLSAASDTRRSSGRTHREGGERGREMASRGVATSSRLEAECFCRVRSVGLLLGDDYFFFFFLELFDLV